MPRRNLFGDLCPIVIMCRLSFIAHRETIALAALLSVLWPTAAIPWCPEPYPHRICAEFFAADIVFTGKVISPRYLSDGLSGFDPGWKYSLKVAKIYRGSEAQTIEVYTENNSGRYQLSKGKSYLLFAKRVQSDGTTIFEIFDCSHNLEVSQARPTILQIEKVLNVKPGSGGHIGGGFRPNSGLTDLSGIRITAEDNGKTYEAVTAKDGSWDMWVPAGTYNLQAKSPDWYISPDDHGSFYPFKDIVIRDGQCGDVEFSGMHITR